MNFDDLPWHDAVLLGFTVNRTARDRQDQVQLQIEWPDGARNDVLFDDCYGLKASFNFGYIGDDHILSASVSRQGNNLEELRRVWRKISVSLDDLLHFTIETSTTASVLDIFARAFYVLDFSGADEKTPTS